MYIILTQTFIGIVAPNHSRKALVPLKKCVLKLLFHSKNVFCKQGLDELQHHYWCPSPGTAGELGWHRFSCSLINLVCSTANVHLVLPPDTVTVQAEVLHALWLIHIHFIIDFMWAFHPGAGLIKDDWCWGVCSVLKVTTKFPLSSPGLMKCRQFKMSGLDCISVECQR